LFAPLESTVLDAVELAVALEMMVKLKIPAMVWGPPGIGKSDILRQIAAKLGYTVIDYRLLLRNPVDLAGVPHVLFENNGGIPSRNPTEFDHVGYTVWSRPDVIVNGKYIILFEEINAAPPEVQAAAFQILLDRAIGPHKLGDDVVMLCAGNRVNDKGAAYPMLSPLSDRLEHYDLTVKLAPWLQWATRPENNIHPVICGYLRLRDKYDVEDQDMEGRVRGADNPNPFQVSPSTLLPTHRMAQPQMPTKIEVPDHCGMLHRFMPSERSFPTPRSWARTSEILYEIEANNLAGSRIEFASIAGKVGHVAATELSAFAKMFRQGYSIDNMIRNPDTAPVPPDAGMRLAVASALARHANRTSIRNIITYAERALPEEFRVMLIDDAERRNPDLAVTAAFRDFSIKYAEVRGATAI
jgi:hypothetical protein